MATRSRIIPLEITHLIINEIKDIKTLRSFSQTCKALLSYCRRILFRSIDEQLGMPESRRTIRALNNLLVREGNEEVASYVKEFCYYIQESHAQNREVISILKRLSNLQKLELYFTISPDGIENWNEIPDILKNPLRDLLSLNSLEKLVLNDVDNFPVTELWRARNLKELEVYTNVNFVPHPAGSSFTGLHGPPRLHRFSVIDSEHCPEAGKCLPVLCPSGIIDFDPERDFSLPAVDFSQLKELSIIIYLPEDWNTGEEIIDMGRNTLQHIHYEVEPTTSLKGLGECITGTDNGTPNLKSLKLKIFVGYLDHDSDDEDEELEEPFLSGLCEELSILEEASDKHALERIDITISIRDDGNVSTDRNDWRKFGEIFFRPGFLNPRCVRWKVKINLSTPYIEDEQPDLRRRLSELEEKVFKEKERLAFDYSIMVSKN